MEQKFKVPRKDDSYEVFSIRMSKPLIAQADEIAHKTNRSRNEIINLCVKYAINNFEDEISSTKKPQD
ncbi:MAG: CopG family transcriptional regulator [Bacillota bacterium]